MFKYPGLDQYALQDVSFKLLPGQLCVIVGANGSGKSTILKVVVRLYDPSADQILLDGHDPFPHGEPTGELACRVYVTEAGLRGRPSREQLHALLAGRLAA